MNIYFFIAPNDRSKPKFFSMQTITATLIAYYHTCHRKLWLFANDISMEHNSDVVYAGKLIGESSYPARAAKGSQVELSVALDGQWTGTAKIDYYDTRSKTVHETKKSDKMEQAHQAQVKYYLYLLSRSGVSGARGLIEYPKLRERTWVDLPSEEHLEVESWIEGVKFLLDSILCPPLEVKPICKQCAYYDFCFANEVDQPA